MRSALLPIFVLAGGVIGILIGSFSPILTDTIRPVGEIYIRLMEVVVLPYLVSSLILGLGQLVPATALKLFRTSWWIYLLLWGATFAVIMLMASTVPLISHPTVVNFSSTVPYAPEPGHSLIDLLVPDNLFQALSQDYIPSVVLMGVIFGIAVQHSEKPTSLLGILAIVRTACVRIWGWIVYFAPIGICALIANSVHSMSLSGFATMSIYILVVMLSALLLALWVLPMLLTCFLPLRYSEILSALRDAFLVAVVTSLSVAALPLIQSAVESFARKLSSAPDDERSEIVQTTLSVSYPLAQLGNFFILIFLFYATYYYSVHLEPYRLVEMPFVTLLSGIGSPTSSIDAVEFMTSWLGIPREATNLYVETMSITRYAQVVASVSGFAFITLFVTFAFYGQLRFDLRALVLTLSVTAVALLAIWSLGRWGGSHIQLQSNVSYMSMGLPADIQKFSDANDTSLFDDPVPSDAGLSTPEDTGALGLGTIDRIQSRGILRVGYNDNIVPFVYKNGADRLVGYDMELIYRFAQSMNVKLEFVPFSWQKMSTDLINHKFDIAIGGIYITDTRLQTLTVSEPYFQSPLALIVRNERVDEFKSRKSIESINNLTIAVFDDPVLIPLAKRNFPSANLKILPDYSRLADAQGVDAAIWTQEQARAWAISQREFSAAVPRNVPSRFLFGYLMPPRSSGLVDYLNYWMRLERENGTLDDMARRWIDPAVESKVD